ncbi:phage baseplate assembly protein [Rhodoferax sp. BLA1]|uniref:phage baseplate assembly protein domain-containing protein n=1 Tax=Rhodoferax sp. BLA1 TaxID=2576062 RepID=UPI0015D26BAE|nr:phage baseplate assembly protein [Rhodoferax sp. BLA1]
MIGQVWRRLQLLVAQGVGRLVGAEFVQVGVLDGETVPKARRVEPYGLSYRPKPGCQVYLVFPGGDRAEGIALVIGDKRYQMDLAEGEVALHDDEGNFVKMGRGGVVTIKASGHVNLETPSVRHNGIEIGTPHTHGGVLRGGASTYGVHG